MKKFVLLIYQGTTPMPGSDRWNAMSADEQKAVHADYGAINATPGVSPGLPLGLPPAARTVQVRDGRPQVRNGPYLSEGVGGYLVVETDTLDAAIEVAARIPAARLGGGVEVRPAEEYW